MPRRAIHKVVVSCSGSCPIGVLCDGIARKLDKEKKAEMLGLSQILSDINAASKLATADIILLLEGCHVGCLRNSLDGLGYDQNEYHTLDLSQMGFDRKVEHTEVALERGYRETINRLKTESTRE